MNILKKITKINNTLTEIIEVANALIAWLIIIACAGYFYLMGGESFIFGILGVGVGFILATLFNGLLALLINIRNDMRRTAIALENLKSLRDDTPPI